jgi:hypothetical protein
MWSVTKKELQNDYDLEITKPEFMLCFQDTISRVNSLGMRYWDVPDEKGDLYIVYSENGFMYLHRNKGLDPKQAYYDIKQKCNAVIKYGKSFTLYDNDIKIEGLDVDVFEQAFNHPDKLINVYHKEKYIYWNVRYITYYFNVYLYDDELYVSILSPKSENEHQTEVLDIFVRYIKSLGVPTNTEVDSLLEQLSTLSVNDVKDKLMQVLSIYNSTWTDMMKLEQSIKMNVPIAFSGEIGRFGELICGIIANKHGCGSKGGCGFDLVDKGGKADEVKTICFIQPKSCNSCDSKVPFFQPTCTICGGADFRYIRDSRAGINVVEHFKYLKQFENYWFVIIDFVNEQIDIKIYKIRARTKYFEQLLMNQYQNSKSTTCNIIPYSYDFYAIGPIRICEILMSQDKIDITLNLDNTTHEEFSCSVLSSRERDEYCIARDIETVPYQEIESKLKVRKKTLGRARGNLDRNRTTTSETEV